MDPKKRITAGDAFIHEFFIESPRWVPPNELKMDFRVESVHEYSSRNRSNSTKAVAAAAAAAK
jgi:hypothetical protein